MNSFPKTLKFLTIYELHKEDTPLTQNEKFNIMSLAAYVAPAKFKYYERKREVGYEDEIETFDVQDKIFSVDEKSLLHFFIMLKAINKERHLMSMEFFANRKCICDKVLKGLFSRQLVYDETKWFFFKNKYLTSNDKFELWGDKINSLRT